MCGNYAFIFSAVYYIGTAEQLCKLVQRVQAQSSFFSEEEESDIWCCLENSTFHDQRRFLSDCVHLIQKWFKIIVEGRLVHTEALCVVRITVIWSHCDRSRPDCISLEELSLSL